MALRFRIEAKKEIGNYVFVKSVLCKYANSLGSDPEFSFELDIMNTSVFDVRVAKEIDDNIDFKSRQLRGLKLFRNSPDRLKAMNRGVFYLVQNLNKETVNS